MVQLTHNCCHEFYKVRIWGDKMQCLSEIRNAHDGGSVDAVAYLSTPRSLDRHILLTAVLNSTFLYPLQVEHLSWVTY
jgi:hypothetical protein